MSSEFIGILHTSSFVTMKYRTQTLAIGEELIEVRIYFNHRSVAVSFLLNEDSTAIRAETCNQTSLLHLLRFPSHSLELGRKAGVDIHGRVVRSEYRPGAG